MVPEWTPITFSYYAECYGVFLDPTPVRDELFIDGFKSGDTFWWGVGNPWAKTLDKTDTSILVVGLDSATTCEIVIRTITSPHGSNVNQVVSEPSATVSATTLAQ